jgi:hypothetical protein
MRSFIIRTNLRGVKIKANEMGKIFSSHEGNENNTQYFVEKPERNGPLWGHRHRWKKDIKKDLKSAGCEGVN